MQGKDANSPRFSLGYRAQGFAMPIILGFGFLIFLIGLTLVLKSQNDAVSSASGNAAAQGQAATETGVAILQSFLNGNRRIAAFPACTSWNSSGSCADTTVKSWATATTTTVWPELGTGCGGGSSTSATAIAAMATRTWQDIDPADPLKGQYRLIDYTYAPTPGTVPGIGTLIVEGRVKQIGSGSTATSSSATATSRLSVSIPVSAATSSTQFPGLWVQAGVGTKASGSTAINASLRDSSCDGSATINLSPPKAPSSTLANATTSQTPGSPFPSLPGGGIFSAPTSGAGVYAISAISLSGSGTASLPQASDMPNASNVYTYNIAAAGGKSINLSGSSYITVGKGIGDKVALYLQGSLNTSGGTRIIVTPGSKMTLYVNGDVTLSGGSTTNPPPIVNSGGAENAQVYVYGTRTIQLSGGSNMSAFIFGPNSAVADMSGGSNVTGAIWVNSWSASGSAYINQATVDQSQLETQLTGSLAIGPAASWQQQQAQ